MATASPEVELEQLGLATVLNHFRLHVPPNQREFAWTDKEVGKLLTDIQRAIGENVPYFLGMLVTIPQDERELEVVDGQQRLATTALLLAAIRDYLRDKNEPVLVQAIESEFLTGFDRDARDLVPRLRLNTDDDAVFRALITAPPGASDPIPTRNSHDLLIGARNLVRDHVRGIVHNLDASAHGDELNRWVKYLENRAQVVLLKVASDADAFYMFETLNDRGLPTSQVDLVKSYVFKKAGARMKLAETRWSYMRSVLESTFDEAAATLNFLRYATIVQKGHLRGDEVHEKVRSLVKSEATAITFAGTLETLANVYVALANSDHERWNPYPDAMRRLIQAHLILDIKPMRSLLLAITSKMEPREATAAAAFLVSLGVRLNIASNTRSASVEEPLGNAARDVFSGEVDTAADLRAVLDGITPKDGEFESAFAKTQVSTSRLARYYLRTLESAYKGVPDALQVHEDRQVINIDHVLPKKPEPGWGVTVEDIRQHATKLGNQVLMFARDNSDLGSRPFSERRATYGASNFELTRIVAAEATWDGESIDRRQKKLAEYAVRAWPITAPASPKRRRRPEPEEDFAEAAFRIRNEATGG